MNEKVILVHGYLRTYRDMVDLKGNLEKLGYGIILVDLPLTFSNIERAANIFEKKVNQVINNLEIGEKINLVGHSTGGLIIRLFLSNTLYIDKIHRCVLVATPNKGCQLADIASEVFKTFTRISKTLKSLKCDEVEKLKLTNEKQADIGVIAGNKSNLFLGKLLGSCNDGRIEIDSALYENAKDYIILPLNHKEIHRDLQVAKYIDRFLQYGNFNNTNT